jgi:hypothetical protein
MIPGIFFFLLFVHIQGLFVIFTQYALKDLRVGAQIGFYFLALAITILETLFVNNCLGDNKKLEVGCTVISLIWTLILVIINLCTSFNLVNIVILGVNALLGILFGCCANYV